MLEHGGKLRQAAAETGIPLANWLDLSTGVAPWPYPLPELPVKLFHRLPENDDGLEEAALLYYQVERVLPVSGSQAAIKAVPRLLKKARVGVLDCTYNEHPHAWQAQGHELVRLNSQRIFASLDEIDALVICNPNNPTGTLLDPEHIFSLHRRLNDRGGLLVVDEAFMDATTHMSITPQSNRPGLLVFRSLGKFFGMAGARVGFVMGDGVLLNELQEELGPWTIAAPSRWSASIALSDCDWQAQQRKKLITMSEKLKHLLVGATLAPSGSTEFFQWVKHPDAAKVHAQLKQSGILTRFFQEPCSLRFGLPAVDAELQRIEQALAQPALRSQNHV